MNAILPAIVGIGLAALAGFLANLARAARDSQKGSAALATYANQPFSLTVKTWLREPSSTQKAWQPGRLRITESRASWRPVVPFSKPIALTGAVLLRDRRYGLSPADLRIPPSMLVLVMKIENREIEIALPRPNAEIVIYGLTRGSRGQATQPGHPGVGAPTPSDTSDT